MDLDDCIIAVFCVVDEAVPPDERRHGRGAKELPGSGSEHRHHDKPAGGMQNRRRYALMSKVGVSTVTVPAQCSPPASYATWLSK